MKNIRKAWKGRIYRNKQYFFARKCNLWQWGIVERVEYGTRMCDRPALLNFNTKIQFRGRKKTKRKTKNNFDFEIMFVFLKYFLVFFRKDIKKTLK